MANSMDIIRNSDCLLSRKFNLIERDKERMRERIQKSSIFDNAQGSKKYT